MAIVESQSVQDLAKMNSGRVSRSLSEEKTKQKNKTRTSELKLSMFKNHAR